MSHAYARPEFKPYLLILSLKFEIEDCSYEIAKVNREIREWCRPGMHGKRMVAFVIVTDETMTYLVNRLKRTIDQLPKIENFWCMAAPKADDIVGQHGFLDPVCHRIRTGWVEAGDRNKAQNVRRSQRR